MPRDSNERIATAATPRPLGPQLVLHDEDVLRPEIRPVRNDPKSLRKPRGGLWSSSYDPDYGSGWVRWCVAHRYNDPLDLHWTVLSIPESARIAVIDSKADLAALIERYPRTLRGRRGVDFERLGGDYDGLHLTQEGYLRTRSTWSKPSLIGWDRESTLWLRWVFTASRGVAPHFKDGDRFDGLWLKLSGWTAEDYACHRMVGGEGVQKSLRNDASGDDYQFPARLSECEEAVHLT